MDYEALVAQALQAPAMTDARQRALRRDRDLGLMMTMTGAPGISQAGGAMYQDASEQLGRDPLDRLTKTMGVMKAARDMTSPNLAIVADPVYGGWHAVDKRTGLPVQTGGGGGGAPAGGVNPRTQLARIQKMPAALQTRFQAASEAMSSLPEIIAQVEGNEEAFGYGTDLASMAPEWAPQVLTEGVRAWQQGGYTADQLQARTAVLQRAYKVINDLAGAAVSAHEEAKIKNFVPSPNDPVHVIVNKLRSAQAEAARQRNALATQYQVPVEQAPVAAPPSEEAPRRPADVTPEEWDSLTPEQKVNVAASRAD